MKNERKKRLSGDFRYAIFRTKKGYCGFLCGERGVLRSCLFGATFGEAKERLIGDIIDAIEDKYLDNDLKTRIIEFLDGNVTDFGDVRVDLAGQGAFRRRVLERLRSIKPGNTISYGELAAEAGSAGAGRAVGNAMANNPIPLIIPCHRVVNADGSTGNYMKGHPKGPELKKFLLQLEKGHRQGKDFR